LVDISTSTGVSIMRLPHLVLATAASISAAGQAWSQSPAERTGAQRTTTVVVMPFDFAAPLPAQPRVVPPHRPSMWPPLLGQPSGIGRVPGFAPRRSFAPPLAHSPVPAPAGAYPAEGAAESIGDAIGVGVADLLVARLLEVPGVRVVERRRLDLLMSEQRLASGADTTANLLRARYIITGSVTRFGTEERRGLGGLGGGFGLGVLGFKRPKTQVALTARIVDAMTGEVIASVTGAGTSTKGGSVLIGGIGGGVGGGVAIGSGEFRASALGEATERAIDALAGAIAAKRALME
jgi:curli biogenesis system outer membrane secretion channel CsgG